MSGKFLQLSGKFLQLSGKMLQLSGKNLQLSGKVLLLSGKMLRFNNFFNCQAKTYRSFKSLITRKQLSTQREVAQDTFGLKNLNPFRL